MLADDKPGIGVMLRIGGGRASGERRVRDRVIDRSRHGERLGIGDQTRGGELAWVWCSVWVVNDRLGAGEGQR